MSPNFRLTADAPVFHAALQAQHLEEEAVEIGALIDDFVEGRADPVPGGAGAQQDGRLRAIGRLQAGALRPRDLECALAGAHIQSAANVIILTE